MLGHAAGTTTSRYLHQVDSVLVAATENVSAHASHLMGGSAAELDAPGKLLARWDREATRFAAEQMAFGGFGLPPAKWFPRAGSRRLTPWARRLAFRGRPTAWRKPD